MMMNVVFKGENKIWRFPTSDIFKTLEILYDTFKDFKVWGVNSDGETIYFN